MANLTPQNELKAAIALNKAKLTPEERQKKAELDAMCREYEEEHRQRMADCRAERRAAAATKGDD